MNRWCCLLNVLTGPSQDIKHNSSNLV
uniref:Uncharacterized protein n=1 Tax=Arundo donax TaxID=35708 RepID=A0A0A9AA48_ARUDO